MEAHLAPNHHDLVNCMQALATTLIARDQYPEAEDLFREVIRRGDASEPGRSAHAAQSSMNLALSAQQQKDHARALELIVAAIPRTAVAYGADHWRIGHAEEQRADILHSLGREAEARAALERAVAIYTAVFGAEHGWTLRLNEKLKNLAPEVSK